MQADQVVITVARQKSRGCVLTAAVYVPWSPALSGGNTAALPSPSRSAGPPSPELGTVTRADMGLPM